MEIPPRIKALITVGAVLLVIVLVTLSLAVTVTLAIASAGLLLTLVSLTGLVSALAGWKPLEPRPQLEIDLELVGPACALVDSGRPWIDVDAVVEEQLDAAWATAPPPAAPDTPMNRMLGLSGPSLVVFADPMRPKPSAADHERFAQRTENYEAELRVWLADLDTAIWKRCSQLEVRVVVRNVAERAPARDVNVNVNLAAGLTMSTGPADVDAPPTRPKWRRTSHDRFSGSLIAPYRPQPHIALTPIEVIRGHPSGSGSCWSVRLPRVLHAGAIEASSELELQVVEPGRYAIEAVARTTSLTYPVVRSVMLEIPDARGSRMATLHEVERYLGIELDEDST